MNLKDFENSSAGRLVRTRQEYWAFIPNPLPPVLNFSPGLVSALSNADRILGELNGIGGTLKNPHLLIRPFARREAVLSSRIEGTQASLQDLYTFEAVQLPLFETGDVREVYNYVQALDYGLERLKTLPMSLRLIKEVHARLMVGVRGDIWTPGEFRRSQNWIGPVGCTLETATYVPPPVEEMISALEALEDFFYNSTQLPPLIRMGLIHYQFEAIHPFLDGNGRMGRLMNVLLLNAWGLLTQPMLYLSPYFEKNRQQYYTLLKSVSQQAAWEEWLLFFLEAVINQGNDEIQKIRQLQTLQLEYYDRIQNTTLAAPLQLVIDLLFSQPILGIRQVETALGVKFPTAQRYIDRLVEIGIVRETTGRSRNRIYLANEIFKIIQNV